MRIFIVDDDRELSRNLELILSGKGYEVRSFLNPESALYFVQSKPDVDLLIIDYDLKVFTAEYFLERVRKLLPGHCKVILISGHTDTFEQLDPAYLGADVFLPKPLDLHRLLREIEAAGVKSSQSG